MDETLTPEHCKKVASIITEYFSEASKYFRELTDLRIKGWQTADGDEYFKDQRNKSDNADHKRKQCFYNMACQIGNELDKETSVITLAGHGNDAPQIMDIGMAPGGFTTAVLNKYPRAIVRGITLPVDEGGLDIMLSKKIKKRIQPEFLDVTMLANEMGIPVETIPDLHPDSVNFSSQRPFLGEEFDLIFCGAAVQRKHSRAPYRNSCERLRLTASQLILALQRVREGGSLVILLHKVESWDNIDLIKTFKRFSDVVLFKSEHKHASRSSFYMIASNVQPRHIETLSAIHSWKSKWENATLYADGGLSDQLYVSEEFVRKVLNDFGQEFIRLATPVWKSQIGGLRKILKQISN